MLEMLEIVAMSCDLTCNSVLLRLVKIVLSVTLVIML